ncbi:autoinducer [Anaerobacillus isosaccharinicus]|uniref:Autoinducer n=1 Tax=Anaerobacillus isosaccharinicus TaxID=1532552 RepID=A0A1S2MDR6_9BACI|nr:hypothetical protein [Anaerobacillus isosaccharinicus]MBA5587118.1 autoinducer [Anaerobacillus isosaccharinicus]QOY34686.1 autoinducer [Anaerobacillus isosaccharinicus]
MKHYKVIFLVTMFILSFTMLISANESQGKTHEEKQIEEFIKGNDYIPAKKAIAQFQKMYGEKVNLPRKLPFEPTHRFGNIDKDGRLKLHFLRPGKIDEYPTLDFVFYVMPQKDLDMIVHSNDKVYNLKNEEKAFYRKHHNDFHSLAFVQNKLGYYFGANPDKIDLDSFTEIAESIK